MAVNIPAGISMGTNTVLPIRSANSSNNARIIAEATKLHLHYKPSPKEIGMLTYQLTESIRQNCTPVPVVSG
jgi:hypothetical protein